jgi:hypothetical protein
MSSANQGSLSQAFTKLLQNNSAILKSHKNTFNFLIQTLSSTLTNSMVRCYTLLKQIHTTSKALQQGIDSSNRVNSLKTIIANQRRNQDSCFKILTQNLKKKKFHDQILSKNLQKFFSFQKIKLQSALKSLIENSEKFHEEILQEKFF